MTTQLLAILASAGLVTAGVAASAETRSASAIPVASAAGFAVAGKAKVSTGVASARQGGRPDCALAENAGLPACQSPGGGNPGGGGGGGLGGGGGVSGGVLGAIGGGLGITAIVIAAKKKDSNG